MAKIAWVLLFPALTGCFFFSGGEASTVRTVPPELKHPGVAAPPVSDRHPYGDAGKLAIGQWATYREGERALTVAAVARDSQGTWIEVIEEGEPRQVSARLVAPDGTVKKAYYSEVSKSGATRPEPQALRQWTPPPVAALTEVAREAGGVSVRVGDRELQTRSVRVTLEDLEGRRVEELTLWHKEVPPVYAGSEEGGLIRRTAGGVVVELTAFGADAKPTVSVPR